MKPSKISLIFILFFFSLIFLYFYTFKNKREQIPKNNSLVTISDSKIIAEVADTPEKIKKGLSGRKFLEKDKGMLFLLKPDSRPIFWMKDMQFAIDIIWINDGKVIGIEKNVYPQPGKKEDELTLYYPPEPVDYVLEVNASFAKSNNIKVGDSVNITINFD